MAMENENGSPFDGISWEFSGNNNSIGLIYITFDVKKTKDYFDGMNISMDEYIKKSEIANAEYLNFFQRMPFEVKQQRL